MSCAAIIVAAGQSRRMGFDKLAASFHGTSVLERSVRRMLEVPEIDHLVVVCNPERFEILKALAAASSLERVDGGAERQDSVWSGLQRLLAFDHVAIHDGARPLVSAADVSAVITAAGHHGAASLARPATETLKRADASGGVIGSIDREGLWFMETPQVFRTDLLHEAYQRIRESQHHITDEVSALEHLGQRVQLVPSSSPNPKITVAADLQLARALTD